MYNPFFWVTIGLAAADWAAVFFRWNRAHLWIKPGVLAALIVWFSLASKWEGILAAFGLGLVFSLIGDFILLLPLRYFTWGMVAFFIAHLFYIGGFNMEEPLVSRWEAVFPALMVGAAFVYLNNRVRNGLARRGDHMFLLPFVAYGVVLSLMWLSALNTLLRPGWTLVSAIMVSLGGTLFFLSDSILVYHRFVRRLRYGDLIVMVTYHLAQILIAGGALEQFLF
jgi:uncharacterized membrane protein YhhN